MNITTMRTNKGYIAHVNDGHCFGRGTEKETIEEAVKSAMINYRGNRAMHKDDEKRTNNFMIRFGVIIFMGLAMMCLALVAHLFLTL